MEKINEVLVRRLYEYSYIELSQLASDLQMEDKLKIEGGFNVIKNVFEDVKGLTTVSGIEFMKRDKFSEFENNKDNKDNKLENFS